MIQGGGQDNPAGLSSPPGGKINQLGYLTPRGEDIQGGGQDIPGQLAPGGQAVQGGKINCYTGIRHAQNIGVPKTFNKGCFTKFTMRKNSNIFIFESLAPC